MLLNLCHTQNLTIAQRLLREDGYIKPVINLATRQSYKSIKEASRINNIPINQIRISCKEGKVLKDSSLYAFIDANNKIRLKDNENHQEWLNSGRINERYLRKNVKRVKNLVTGIIYNSIGEAAEKNETSVSAIYGCASGKYLIFKEKYVFCFLKEDGTEDITDRHLRALEKVKNIDNDRYVAWKVSDEERKFVKCFKTLDDICKNLNIKSKSHIKNVCDGKRSHVEGWRIAFLDDKGRITLKSLHLKKPNKIIRKVICLNDGKFFKNCSEAGMHYSISDEQIGKVAKGVLKSVYYNKSESKMRLRFAYLDDEGKPVMTDKHTELLSSRRVKFSYLVTNTETQEEFKCYSWAEINIRTGIPKKRIYKYLQGKPVNIGSYRITKSLH